MFREVELEQRSEEWLAFRKKHIMASDAPIILGVSKYKQPDQLLKEKLDKEIKERKITAAMRKGIEIEPKLLDLFNRSFSKHEGKEKVFRPAVIEKLEASFPRGASLDGVSEDFLDAVEIKVTNKINHEKAANKEIPEEFIPQLHHQMEVLDLQEMWYLSYYIPWNDAIVLRVKRKEDFLSSLLEKEQEFWNKISLNGGYNG